MIDWNGDLIASWTPETHARVKRDLVKLQQMHNGLLSTTEADLYIAIHEIERLQTRLDVAVQIVEFVRREGMYWPDLQQRLDEFLTQYDALTEQESSNATD